MPITSVCGMFCIIIPSTWGFSKYLTQVSLRQFKPVSSYSPHCNCEKGFPFLCSMIFIYLETVQVPSLSLSGRVGKIAFLLSESSGFPGARPWPSCSDIVREYLFLFWMLAVPCKNQLYLKGPYLAKDPSKLSFYAPFPPSQCLHDSWIWWYLASKPVLTELIHGLWCQMNSDKSYN